MIPPPPPPPDPDPAHCTDCRNRLLFYGAIFSLALTLITEHGLKFVFTGSI